ncbi:MAG: glycosyltransferase [Cyclobacteriaceae bacterium]
MTFLEFKGSFERKVVSEFIEYQDRDVLVSVCVFTFNHAAYIRSCLNGILRQRVNFDFELLIGEDNSTDGTREICIEYAERYPDKIRLFLHHDENKIKIGRQPTGRFNFIYSLFSAKGEYLAICDGDDFWTDSSKLQKQIDRMLSDREISMSFHNAKESIDGISKRMISIGDTGYVNPKSIVEKQYRIPTLSMVFKRNIIKDFDLVVKVRSGDRYLEIASIGAGKCFYFKDIMGVKRTLHSGLLKRWKAHRLDSVAQKYESNALLLNIVPSFYRTYMHRYLFEVCLNALGFINFRSTRFLPLAVKHFILSLRFSLRH